MREQTLSVVLVALVGFASGFVTANIIADARPADAKDAVRLCEETGGQLLVTEYNTVTGLTLNCFYALEEVGINPDPDSIAL